MPALNWGGLVTVDEYNAFCSSLPHTHHVVQWGGAHVWKVAGKVFAIAGWNDTDEHLFVTFKCSDLSYDLLKGKPGLRPAPYLASRGMKWIQRTGPQSMNDRALRDYLAESHRIVSLGLPKRMQRELGLNKAGKAARRPVRSTKPANARRSRAASGDAP